MEENVKQAGYLESAPGRKSNSRLTIAICACICIFATLIEGAAKIVSIIHDDKIAEANWYGITTMVAVLLLGASATKAAQGFKEGQLKK